MSGWYFDTVYKEPEGAESGTGTQWVGLPVDGKTFVLLVYRQSFASSDSAQYVRNSRTTFQVESLGPDVNGQEQYRIGPNLAGSLYPAPASVETTTPFPPGPSMDAVAFLVSYESVKQIPVPPGLNTILQNGIPATVAGT